MAKGKMEIPQIWQHPFSFTLLFPLYTKRTMVKRAPRKKAGDKGKKKYVDKFKLCLGINEKTQKDDRSLECRKKRGREKRNIYGLER